MVEWLNLLDEDRLTSIQQAANKSNMLNNQTYYF